ncbi:hypothetical protein GCM10010518_17980 [Kitasatospora cinereorecta]
MPAGAGAFQQLRVVVQVEDWAEIRRLHRAEEMPIRAIARHLGISKNTVKRALATDQPPTHSRPLKGSAVDAVEPQIRELLKQTPTMPTTVSAGAALLLGAANGVVAFFSTLGTQVHCWLSTPPTPAAHLACAAGRLALGLRLARGLTVGLELALGDAFFESTDDVALTEAESMGPS